MFTRKPNNFVSSQEGAESSLPHSNSTPRSGVLTAQEAGHLSVHSANVRANNLPLQEEGLVVVGKGTRVYGTIGDCKLVDVHGVLEADIVADKIIVREGGGIKGTVRTDHAEVHGIFEGTLIVDNHLEIQKTGNISGDISYRTLAIQTGAKMRGNIVCSEPEYDVKAVSDHSASVMSINHGKHTVSNGYDEIVAASPIS